MQCEKVRSEKAKFMRGNHNLNAPIRIIPFHVVSTWCQPKSRHWVTSFIAVLVTIFGSKFEILSLKILRFHLGDDDSKIGTKS
jgi:hypothetical protein